MISPLQLAAWLLCLPMVVLPRASNAQTLAEMPWWPENSVTVEGAPLFFSWPHDGATRYDFEIRRTGELSVRTVSVSSNTLTISTDLQNGNYEWRVAGKQLSKWRSFQLAKNSYSFIVPNTEDLIAKAAEKKRPRSRVRSVHSPQADNLVKQASRGLEAALPLESGVRADLLSGRQAQDAHAGGLQRTAFEERSRIEQAVLSFEATGNPKFRDEARRRVLNLAGWNPLGATGYQSQDQASRAISWSLAFAYDRLPSAFSKQERQLITNSLVARMKPFADHLLDPARGLNARPLDSHGVTGLGYLAAISALMAGEDPFFDSVLARAVPRYVGWPIPWGRDDGGFANGTAYAVWAATDFIRIWDVIENTLEIPVWQSAWARGFVTYLSHFLPPGAPAGVFGDETEGVFRKDWATVGKAIAARVPSPYSAWYFRNLFGEDESSVLLAGVTPPQAVNADWRPPNSAWIKSIGWVAMHSNLADRGKVSVFFKSSPYGSFNHSHADQNSFVIHAGGRALATASGYYDYYGSPHWHRWYKQTVGHNAITYNGGRGQDHDSLKAQGSVLSFSPANNADIVTGDATRAYGGEITRAVRSLAYVRPGLVIVSDSLESGVARTWEWNLHSPSEFRKFGAGQIQFDEAGSRACVKLLSGPDGQFSISSTFPIPPEGKRSPHHHLRWATSSQHAKVHLVFSIDIGCSHTDLHPSNSAAGLVMDVAGSSLLIKKSGEIERK